MTSARRTHRTAALLAAGLLGPSLLLGACGGDDSGASPAITVATTLSGAAAITTPPQGTCTTKSPGEPLDAAEAVVRFSTSGVCPSYVTIKAGTPVRWTNDHSSAVTLSLTAAAPAATGGRDAFGGGANAADGAELFRQSVAPGATFERQFDAAGTYYFRLDLIPTFLGTVEVQ